MTNSVDDEDECEPLLADYLRAVIQTPTDYERAMNLVSKLLDRGTSRSVTETAFLKVLSEVVSAYEEKLKLFNLGETTPRSILKHLMEANGHTAKDIWLVVGDKGTVSRILNGKRTISKEAAKRLSGFYHVPLSLFI